MDLTKEMTCVFPLRKLLEIDEFATLEDLDEFRTQLFEDATSISSTQSLLIKTSRKTAVKKSSKTTQIDIIQCLVTIFDDTIDQIHILSGGKMSANAIDEFNKSMQERIQDLLLDDPIYDKDTAQPYPVYFTTQKLRKSLTDSSKLNQFLILIRNELREEFDSKSIRTITNNIIRRKYNEEQLLQEERNNFKFLKDLKHLIGNQNKEIKKSVDDVKNTLYKSKDQTQDLLFENLLREKYVKYWELARREQNDLCSERAENELQNSIDRCNNEIITEYRVSNEEKNFLLEEEKDFKYNIKLWSHKLAEETDARLIQNQIHKNRLEELEKMYEKLCVDYVAHKKEMEVYLNLKDQREKAWEEKERRRIAATKIQAWWRGNMVRHKLGPFNPNKKYRKGKKDKKGKKGKRAKK